MAKAIPDEVMAFMCDEWPRLGLNPALVFRLVEDRGVDYFELDRAMTAILGEDWARVNVSAWIDRMIAAGNGPMIHSADYDTPPVVDILEAAVKEYLAEHKILENT